MLSEDDILDIDCIAMLINYGHSRIPIYAAGRRDNIKGVLLVKKCIAVDSKDNRRIATMPLVPPFFVSESVSASDLLNLFQKHKRHFAIVCKNPQQAMDAAHRGEPLKEGNAIGCITLEDILELILKTDIDDECDVASSVREDLARTFKISHRIKRMREQRKGMEGWRAVRKSTVDAAYYPLEAKMIRSPRGGSQSDTNRTPLLA